MYVYGELCMCVVLVTVQVERCNRVLTTEEFAANRKDSNENSKIRTFECVNREASSKVGVSMNSWKSINPDDICEYS